MHINCHTYFSLRYGTMSPQELLQEAERNRITCLALTDINTTSGVLDFARMAKQYGVRPVTGIDFRNGADQQFIALAKSNNGFLELNDFLSPYLHAQEKIPGTAPEFSEAYVIYPFRKERRELRENEFIGVRPSDLGKLIFSEWREQISRLVILAPVTFCNKRGFNMHRLLRCIGNNTLLSKLPITEQSLPDEVMLSETELSRIYAEYPYLLRNTRSMLDNCGIYFEYGTSKNKRHFFGNAEKDKNELSRLCYENLNYRYERNDKTITDRLEKELRMIHEKGFASYFLINWDIVKYAQHKNYFYVGRGSGANSMVAYLLRITDVDPIDLDLYFERFINPSRINPPDFDIDFSWKDRDDVIRYIFEKHSVRHTALLATYSTFQSNAVIRELGKVFGLPAGEIDMLQAERKNPSTPDHIANLINTYSRCLHDVPNHLGIHAGGILISERPIHYYTATNLPPKNFPTTQFSMLEAEDVGLYKFDILSQRGLGHIKDTVALVKQNCNVEIDIHNIKKFKQDERIRQHLKTARAIGCFYVESPAMRMLLKKLECETYIGLVAASSIIRPGVAQSGMMREYILRFRDPSKAKYIHPKMKELMEETYGVMVYQEDVIKVAHYFAGLTLEEADMMRRGMSGKFKGRDEFKKVEQKFLANCKRIGYPDEITREVWRQIESFAGYAFSKGHSASYAVESYQSLYLKAYHPREHMVGVINNFGGFYRTEIYVHEARMCGAAIHAPDINRSLHTTTIYGKDLYLGFIHVNDLERNTIDAVLTERAAAGAYKSLTDLMKRVSIPVEQLRILIRVGAFRFTGRNKKQLLWDIHTLTGDKKKTEVRKELFETENRKFSLPVLHHGNFDDAMDEMELLGFPLRNPFDLIKNAPDVRTAAADLENNIGKTISIIGYLVTTKRTRTKRGQEMSFGTFLDREGYFIDTSHFPEPFRKFPFRGRGCYLITGRVAEEYGFCSVDVTDMHLLERVTRDD